MPHLKILNLITSPKTLLHNKLYPQVARDLTEIYLLAATIQLTSCLSYFLCEMG